MLTRGALFSLALTLLACGNSITPPPQDSAMNMPDATCFPPPSCDGPQRCTGMLTYEIVESRPCAEVCGAQACLGSTCVATSAVQMCPAGTRCVAYRLNDPRGFSSPTPCMPVTAADSGM